MGELRTPTAAEIDRIYELSIQAFNAPRALLEARRPLFKPEEWIVNDESGRITGTVRGFDLPHWFGGRVIGGTGVAGVTVAAEARGAGLARTMMRALLERTRAAGNPISTLYPATVSLYRACGYGFGSVFAEWKVDLKDLPRAPQAPGISIEPFDDGAAVNECYQAFASKRNGLTARHPEWWKTRVLFTHESPQYAYLVRENGVVTGWIVYTIASIDSSSWGNRIDARDLFWTTPGAARALLSLLSHHRSTIESMQWVGPPIEPLSDLFDEEHPELKSTFRSMVRLVDVPAAFERRGYDAHVTTNVTIGVDDPFFEENSGPWEVAVSGGTAKVVRATSADARADVATWSSIWAAELLPVDAARQGRLHATDASLTELTAMFAGPAPWTSDFY